MNGDSAGRAGTPHPEGSTMRKFVLLSAIAAVLLLGASPTVFGGC